jgi:hypothetical protein
MAVEIKADDKAIAAYYERVAVAQKQEARHEGNIRRAFGNLLEETARGKKWSLVTEESVKVAGSSKSIRYDGVVRADFGTTRGHWEAKDEEDDLDVEIRKKRERGYSFKNIIFEDTRQAVLFQDGYEVYRIDLGDADDLADLLNRFYNFQIEAYDDFEQAVTHFQDEIPHVAQDLLGKITTAHEGNKQFQNAFTDFMELCRTSLNPNMVHISFWYFIFICIWSIV